MSNNFLNDSNGNKSSKRLWGSILLSVGIVLATILFFKSLEAEVADKQTTMNIINMFLVTGGGLLGVGVLESVIRKPRQARDDYGLE